MLILIIAPRAYKLVSTNAGNHLNLDGGFVQHQDLWPTGLLGRRIWMQKGSGGIHRVSERGLQEGVPAGLLADPLQEDPGPGTGYSHKLL